MCGIAGFVHPPGSCSSADSTVVVRQMAATLTHRGPDGEGAWVDAQAGIALGFRRLAIIDLSPHGDQPMTSASGRYLTIYNGEVFNHLELRQVLTALGHRFSGRSDTEVMLAAFEQWGLSRALDRLNGMFAIALWDRKERVLHLVRDRVGEKPLYYGVAAGGVIVFGSDLPALAVHPGFEGRLDRRAVAEYFRHGFVPGPHSILQHVWKVPPGAFVTITPGGNPSQPTHFWSPLQVASAAAAHRFKGTAGEAVARTEDLLRRSIAARMIADVPLGALLSGGIDSSTVVALMQEAGPGPVRTFTVSFPGTSDDEGEHARKVAVHLGTQHEELAVGVSEIVAAIDGAGSFLGEPLGDTAFIPTLLIARLARRHVTVGMAGDGGDEVFGGYARYKRAAALWRAISLVPRPMRERTADLIWKFDSGQRRASRHGTHAVDRPAAPSAEKLRSALRASTPEDIGELLVRHWTSSPLLDAEEVTPRESDIWSPMQMSPIERIMYREFVAGLPDGLLVKLDRATMAASLEGRLPMLDHELVEFAWSVPAQIKYRGGQTKWLLREILRRRLPSEMVDRPKKGFGVPLGTWLRGPLRDWAECLIDADRLRNEGLLDPEPIWARWRLHLAGVSDHHVFIWDVLMFESWLSAATRAGVVSHRS